LPFFLPLLLLCWPGFQPQTYSQTIGCIVILGECSFASHRFRDHLIASVHRQSMLFEERTRKRFFPFFHGFSKRSCQPIFEDTHTADGPLIAILPVLEQIRLFFQRHIALKGPEDTLEGPHLCFIGRSVPGEMDINTAP